MTGELCHGADHDHGSPDPATVGVLSSLVASDGSQRVALGSLRPADSPRLDGERIDHVQMLAEAGAGLPPILVHRPTMRVIDGMHRLRAAQSRGAEAVEVQFLDGTEELAFAAEVRANVVHGLPLSRRDREAAVLRILGSHAMWSNRTIAAIVGLDNSTVGTIRRQQPKQAPVRIGRDGRIRPLSTTEGRRRAAEVIAERPGASLREVARLAGISTGSRTGPCCATGTRSCATCVAIRRCGSASPVGRRCAGQGTVVGGGVQKEFPRSVSKFNEAVDTFRGMLSAVHDDLATSGQSMVTAARSYESADAYEAQKIKQYTDQIPSPDDSSSENYYYTPPPWLSP